jgi:uncharacterized damage-inducible protein DinB
MLTMTTVLAEMFRHNLWANLRLLDTCATLDESILHATVEGTYGEIGATLSHLVDCETTYLYRLETGDPYPDDPPAFSGIAPLIGQTRKNGDGLIRIASNHEPGRMVSVAWHDGDTYELPAHVYLAQTITHSAEHRSQIATILTQQGIEPPDVSVWAWCEETKIS